MRRLSGSGPVRRSRARLAGVSLCAVLAGLAAAAVVSEGAPEQVRTPGTTQQQEADYVSAAVLKGLNGPACAHKHAAAIKSGAPPTGLLSILGVLRGPPTAADRVPVRTLSHLVGLYRNYVRFARAASGRKWWVWVSSGSVALLPPANVARCLAAQTAALRQELPGIPAALRAQTIQMLQAQLRAERRRDAQPPPPAGVTLFGLAASGIGGGGGGADAVQITRQGLWVSSGGGTGADPGRTLFAGVVPDGVASVTLHYPRGKLGGFSRRSGPAINSTAPVVNNVVVVAVERAGQQSMTNLTATWRNSHGATIKIFHGNL